jgi:hypothetical protein
VNLFTQVFGIPLVPVSLLQDAQCGSSRHGSPADRSQNIRDEDAIVHKHVAYFEHVGQITPQARSIINENAIKWLGALLGKAQEIS